MPVAGGHYMHPANEALVALGYELRGRGYRFVAITPASHQRVLNREVESATLDSVFGWNRPFRHHTLDQNIIDLLERAEQLEAQNGWLRSKVRFATLGDLLFVHSAFPTASHDAVFFGPDTYRFARALRFALTDMTIAEGVTILDIGCGSGVGGLYAARQLLPRQANIVLSDVNQTALRFSQVNSIVNGFPRAQTIQSDVFEGIHGVADLIISNPPYLVDGRERLYCHGGGELGISLSLRIAQEGLNRLASGGRFVLYTGTPIIAGEDAFFRAVKPFLQRRGLSYSYEEIDPDLFGEELDRPAYACADRIAAVVLTVTNERKYQ
jgi:release factor glutamine methyltransferase